ncbi:MAG: hypothetical protein RI989_323 [Bacteroidota bacterium]
MPWMFVRIDNIDEMKLKLFAVLFLVVQAFNCFAQPSAYPTGFGFTRSAREAALKTDAPVFLSMQPYMRNDLPLSKMEGELKDSVKIYHDVAAIALRKHIFEYNEGDVHVRMNFLYNIGGGKDFTDTLNYPRSNRIISNTRGLWIQADFGEKVSVETGFYESQEYMPKYLKNYVDSLGVIPGFGRDKDFTIIRDVVDYSSSFSRITIQPRDALRFHMGYGKHKIGNGYRSLLWSDGMYNYPYVQFDITKGKVKYSHVWNIMQSLERLPLGDTPESTFRRKAGSFSYLSWKPSSKVELSLFESVIWNRYDANKMPQSLPVSFYSPIIGTGFAQVNSARNNFNIGIDANFRLSKGIEVYGQAYADALGDYKKNGALQLGIQSYNLGVKNFDLGFEYNRVQSDVYSFSALYTDATHMNQTVGHPLNNMYEYVMRTRYRYGRYFARVKWNYIVQNRLEERNDEPTWINRNLKQWDVEVGYWINPKTNSEFIISYSDRIDDKSDDLVKQHATIFMLGIRTGLHAVYRDF